MRFSMFTLCALQVNFGRGQDRGTYRTGACPTAAPSAI
jgi:hypothetical protein